MKKLLLCVLAAFVALSMNASELNIYASGLNATQSAGVTTIDYVLNAPATALNVKLYDGSTLIATIPITGAANLTKGSHSGVEITLPNMNGTFTWALEASGDERLSDDEVEVTNVTIGCADSRGMTIDDNPESVYFGTIYVASKVSTGSITAISADRSSVSTIVSGAPLWTTSPSSPMRLAIGEDGLLYVTDWSDNTPNITMVDRSNNTTSLVFGYDHYTSGNAYNSSNEVIHGSMSGCCVVGTGTGRKLYTIDEDLLVNSKVVVLQYNIGNLTTPWTNTYSAVAFPNTEGKLLYSSSGVNGNVFSDGHDGFWIAQNRYSDGPSNPALMHVNSTGAVDYTSKSGEVAEANTNATYASLFVTHDKSLVVTTWYNKIKFWKPTFVAGSLTSVELVKTIAAPTTSITASNYNVIIDPAQNVYLLGASHMFAYAPASDNICETPAKAANTITATASPVARTVTSGNYGTVCFPHEVTTSNRSGADFFNIAGKRTNDGTVNGTPTSIVLEPVAGNLTAGQPYIFQATASTLSATFTGDVAPAGSNNGLIGSLTGTGVAEGMYLLSGNEIVLCGTGCSIAANRAYINMASVPLYGGSQAPGIREIPLAPQSGTSFQNVEETDSAIKFFENGRILILRGGVVYDTAGRVVRK